MKRFYSLGSLIVTTILFAVAGNASAQTTTFNFTGGAQSYTVGSGITAISLDVRGACGGMENSSTGTPGYGGRVQCTLAVTAGEVLYLYVGGKGGNGTGSSSLVSGGFNGGATNSSNYYGGSGGGATDIRLSPGTISGTQVTPYTTTNRLIVAGGGGAPGEYCYCSSDKGGDGGGTTGGNGNYSGSFNGYMGGGGAQTLTANGSSYYGTSAYEGNLGVGGNPYGCCAYGGGGGGGYYGGGGAGYEGCGGGGSSYPAANGGSITNLIHTQGYNLPTSFTTGNGAVIICSPNFGSILGPSAVCVGGNITLSLAASGGTWTSSTPSVATIDPSAGTITGVAAGVTTITYAVSNACGAGFVTTPITVNPLPATISGASSVCLGSTITLTDVTTPGTWSSSTVTRATIGSTTGTVSPISLGTTTISYTLSTTGCFVTQSVAINPLPSSISGAGAVCASGGTMTLTDPTSGGTWTSGSVANATVDPTFGVVTGATAGPVNITYTLPTGCMVSKLLTVNPLPSAISGSASICAGSSATFTDPTSGGSWSSSNLAVAGVVATSGRVSGVSAGTANIIYTIPTGCSISSSVLVNPAPLAITGSTAACVGGTTTLSDASSGGTYSSSNTALAVVSPGTGVVTGVAAGPVTISYTYGSTGCATSTVVMVNALPNSYSITGGGGYCAGGSTHIGLIYSDAGVNYSLYNGSVQVGSTTPGSNSGLDFGAFTTIGTYTAIGKSTITGCTSNMTGSTTVSVNPVPTAYAVTGGGNFCPGSLTGPHVGTSGSDAGIIYELFEGSSSIGSPMTGTGAAIDFGTFSVLGSYTAVAVNPVTGCSQTLTGSASIGNYPLPTAYNMNAGGGYCIGGTGVHVTLSGSDAGVSYQLLNGVSTVGSPIVGTGAGIDFGLQTAAGGYTVVATNISTTCVNNMSGTSNIVINPLPVVYTVTGGGVYCAGGAGSHVGLNYSDAGITYKLYNTGTLETSSLGTNSGLDFGLETSTGAYTVVAVNSTTGCTSNMAGTATVNTTPVPVSYNVTGGGSYCSGGTGVRIGLDNSSAGIRYQVMFGTGTVGSSVTGTGGALSFGPFTAGGSYTIMATNASTSCTSNMSGSATININSLPASYTILSSSTVYCAGGSGIDLQLSGSDVGTTYQLYLGGSAHGGTFTGTGGVIDFSNQTTAGTYTVHATNTLGCSGMMAGAASITIAPLPYAYLTTGGGNYCAGGTGVHIGLSGSNAGVNYIMNVNGSVSGSSISGTGAAIDFGLETTAGTYTITAADGTSGCINGMAGSTVIVINPLPNSYNVIGGGSYCAGEPGRHIGLDNSDAGNRYAIIMDGTTTVGTVLGSGSSLDFGTFTASGSYTATATNIATGCTSDMTGSENINISPLPTAYPVSGGGIYCSGGAGVDVSLSNSQLGVNYTLYSSSGADTTVAGTGAAIDFGNQMGAGSYTVVGQDASTGCDGNMMGAATVTIQPQPAIDTVTGGGSFCYGSTGVHVGLNTSTSGISYQLYNGVVAVGAAITGSGSSIDFGIETLAGTYTVVASPGGVCATSMSGGASVAIEALPTIYSITGGGAYCNGASGVAMGLSGSTTGVSYQLLDGTTVVGSSMSGTGSALDFGLQTASGTYHVVATDGATGCTNVMTGGSPITVAILPSPIVYNVTGGGSYCVGGSGVHVTLASSSTDVNYQLYMGSTAIGAAMAGTGTHLDFGLQTAVGTYTVIGTDAATLCTSNMNDAASVATNPILTPVISALIGHTTIYQGQVDTLIATVNASSVGTSPVYQWYVNGYAVPGATTLRLISTFSNGDSVTFEATSGGECGGVSSTRSQKITVISSSTGVQQVQSSVAAINVVPNPNKGVFNVTGSLGVTTDEEVTLQVTDLLGHVVYTSTVVAKNGNVNEHVQLGNTLANGMYLLSLHSETANAVVHMVIEQ